MNINSIVLSGNISLSGSFYEPEDKSFCVYDNSLAYNEKFKNEYRTLFIKFKCFGKSAQRLRENLSVGARVTIQGTLSMEISKDKKYKTPVIILSRIDIHTKFVKDKEVIAAESFDFNSVDIEDISTLNLNNEEGNEVKESNEFANTSIEEISDNSIPSMVPVDDVNPFDDNINSLSQKEEANNFDGLSEEDIENNPFLSVL